jgi:hypothetical protein
MKIRVQTLQMMVLRVRAWTSKRLRRNRIMRVLRRNKTMRVAKRCRRRRMRNVRVRTKMGTKAVGSTKARSSAYEHQDVQSLGSTVAGAKPQRMILTWPLRLKIRRSL